MKRMIQLVCLLVACAAFAQETWTFEKPYVWARDDKSITMAREGSVFVVEHTGKKDWALAGFQRIAAKPGAIFEIACKVKLSAPGSAEAQACVILRDEKGKELEWSYGGASAKAPCEWTELKSRFIVPKGIASVEPRLIGSGACKLWAEGYSVKRAGTVLDRVDPKLPAAFKFARGDISLSGDLKEGVLTISDTHARRAWPMDMAAQGWVVLKAETPKPDQTAGIVLTLLNPETLREVRATLTLCGNAELLVTVESEGALPKPLDFPPPIATRKGDRLIVPMNEGMSYPVDEEHQGLWRMIAYGGHGICMGFFGATDDASSGAGWMCILETSDDAAMNARKGANGLWQAGPSWDATMGQFGYTRKARYVFFDKGGHVAMCKRYREHAKQTGLYKPFSEKVKRNPNIDLLIGAANVWRMGSGKQDAVELVKEMQSLGMQRILWSAGGSAEQIKALRALPDVLVGRYDIYQDIMDPANFDKIRYKHGDWVTEAFPQDINWRGPDGDWRHGWEIEKKDGEGMLPCAVICDAKAVPYARKRISEELKVKPYSARFIDTTVAAPWFECYHPDHPMTRTQSRQHKMELLNLISSELGLVCGSETGHEASVPFCDYFEGMLSLGPYRVPDSGRDMTRVWDEVPAALARYQVGEAYRLPLWELVYHDCVVAQWYWGDYNNKLPKVWRKRDLFNALYGTPPMYLFVPKQWDEMKAQFAASYKVATPVSRVTGYSEMTDHRMLTPDRSVQQSVFANGVTVTVNFGDAPYKMADGQTVPPMDLIVKY